MTSLLALILLFAPALDDRSAKDQTFDMTRFESAGDQNRRLKQEIWHRWQKKIPGVIHLKAVSKEGQPSLTKFEFGQAAKFEVRVTITRPSQAEPTTYVVSEIERKTSLTGETILVFKNSKGRELTRF